MRVISEPVRTYSQTLAATPLVQNSTVLPNYGPIQGFWLDLTVTTTGGTHSQTSQTIDNIIQTIEIDDATGNALIVALGTDLSVLNDMLQPRGVRQAPTAITTDSSGDGSAEWYFFFPFTIGVKDMPGQLKVTFAAKTVLQNASLTSIGTATVTLVVRAGYSVGVDQPTLHATMSNPPYAQGDNALSPYLPAGFQAEGLAFVLSGGDADFGYLTCLVGGASFATLMPLNDFVSQDTMLMQSGHLTGEFICRFPQFVIDNTTIFTVNEASSTAIRLYSIATVPQKRS